MSNDFPFNAMIMWAHAGSEYLQSSYDVLNSRKPFHCNVLWPFIGSRNFAVRIKRTDLRSHSARGRQISRNVLRRENQEKNEKK